MADVQESVHVDAPAEVVWGLLSDLTRMGEWSPENTGGKWLGGASGPAVGVKFKGTNRKGGLRWSTVSTIVELQEPTAIAWDVKAGPLPVARWAFRITPAGAGACDVTETWDDQRAGWSAKLTDALVRSGDRADHNRANMRITLDRLKTAAEGATATT